MADIGTLVVKIGADASELSKTFEQLGGNAKQFEKGLENAGKIAGAALIAIGSAAIYATREAGQYAEMLEHVSQQTGIAIGDLQNMTVLLARTGLGFEALVTMNKKLSQTMVEAQNPTSQSAATLERMGITALTTEGAMLQLADRFAMMPDGAGKTAEAVELLGKAGQAMIPILNQGSAAFKESIDRTKELGGVLSKDAISALSQADTAFDDLGVASSALSRQFGAVMAPAITSIVSGLATGAGAAANFFGVIQGGSKDIDNILPLMRKFNSLLTAGGAPGFDVDAVKKNQEAQAQFGQAAKQLHADAVAKADAEARAQEDAGERIVKIAVLKWHASVKVSEAYARELEEADRIRLLNMDMQPPPTSGAFVEMLAHREEAVRNLLAIMPELTRQQALLSMAHNEAQGNETVRLGTQAYAQRFDTLKAGVVVQEAVARQQDVLFQTDKATIGAADAARRVSLELQVRQQALATAELEEQLSMRLISQQDYESKVTAMAIDADTRRRQIVQQFPTFWEQQLRAVVASNAFSVSQIITSWTGGLAGAIVNGGKFVEQAWKATQLAIVQGALNTGVQLAAQWALQASVEMGILSATEAAKLGLKTASNAAIVAGDTAAATATVGVWAGAGVAISGFFAATLTGFSVMMAGMVSVLTAVGTFVMGVLSAIAEALTATVFGIPYAGAILLGVAAIAVALAATGNLGFKDGGIGDFGSGTQATLHGPEAIIPLNSRGANFMREVFGGGNDASVRPIHTHVMLNGREIATAVSDELPGALRTMGAL